MTVRRAAAGDAAAALEVWRAVLAARGHRPSAARTSRVRDKLVARDAVLVVAVEEQVHGFALGEWGRTDDGAGELVPGLLHLSLLAVHPLAQRGGVGSALADGLADTAYRRGARRISAWPRTVEVGTLAFLLAAGLEPTGRTRVLADGGAAAEHVGELEPPLRELVVREGGLRLGQLLKLAGLAETGAQAKALLEAGAVAVDGAVEHRRGRQLRDGEVVVAGDEAIRVVLPGGPVPAGPVPAASVPGGPVAAGRDVGGS